MENNKSVRMLMHEAAVEALKNLDKESSYKEIYTYIIEHKLFKFEAKVEKHENVLLKIIERKCINSNLSLKTKELLFYKKDRKYGLLSWLSPNEIADISPEEQLKNQVKRLKDDLHQLQLQLQRISNTYANIDTFESNYKNFKDEYSTSVSEMNKMKEIIDNFQREKTEVKELLENLKNSKYQMNFEKLNNGFLELLDRKKENKKNIFNLLIVFAGLIFTIPSIIIILIFFNIKLNLLLSMPLLTIEVFLVYYFRIILHKYDSIEEQILQIDNKSALLKFISNYVDYKKDNDVSSDDIIKFEEIIFSKISPNMKTIPTSPDVISIVEKIAKIVSKK